MATGTKRQEKIQTRIEDTSRLKQWCPEGSTVYYVQLHANLSANGNFTRHFVLFVPLLRGRVDQFTVERITAEVARLTGRKLNTNRMTIAEEYAEQIISDLARVLYGSSTALRAREL